jgi:hypothetical protein
VIGYPSNPFPISWTNSELVGCSLYSKDRIPPFVAFLIREVTASSFNITSYCGVAEGEVPI